MNQENVKICQSCGMPMAEGADLFGTNQDGSPNDEYCKYCFKDGTFGNPDETLEEMINSCVPFMVEEGMSAEDARTYLEKVLPTLKRWKKD